MNNAKSGDLKTAGDPAAHGETLRALGLGADNAGVWSGEHGWNDHGDGPTLESINPASGRRIATVRAATAADYERVMSSAVAAAALWRAVPAPKRGEAVRLIGEELRLFKDALGSLVSLENGKIKAEGDGEVQEMIDIADFAVGQSRMLYGLTMHSERRQHRMYEQWHPLGVVGVISAFNFPVAVWSWNAFLAAICGNATVWKPSPKTALCAIAVQRICNRVLERHSLPPIFQLFVDAGNSLAGRFVDDRRVALVSFTGSTEVGRHVGVRVAERLGKSLLELGGNNAIIVDASANLDLAVPGIVFGAIGTAGQRCTTTRRVLAHRSVITELERRLVAAYRQVRIGDPLDKATLMGPLIDAGAVRRYLETVAAAEAQGGRLLCGGRTLAREGHFVEPAIIRATASMPIVQTETFAPILYLLEYDDLDEAIAAQNSVAYGLSSAIFTDRLQVAERFLSAGGSDCGIANVNIGTSGAEIGGAFGGEKDTGGGREAGSDAWKSYMRRQTTTINWSAELPLAQDIVFTV
ncbi:MAG: aldehyde dehydrogenase family protein [Gammaproteobacteria bacterium]|nr:aldehyde dehydrogenase family protein [Gammaproteobacteria bacterium]